MVRSEPGTEAILSTTTDGTPRLCDRAASGPSDENNLVQIAEAHDVTTAQVIVAWHLAHGFVVIHKSVRRERIEANAAGARVELTDDEVAAIDSLGS